MTAQNGLFVQSNGIGTGTTVKQARLGISGLLATNSANPLDVRSGVLFSGTQNILTPLASTGPMMVRVAPLHYAVARPGGLDGSVLGSNDADGDVSMPAPPALGSKRIDVIYIQQQDANASISPDAVTASTIGVLQGAASSSPVKPTTLPAGAVELGTVTYDATSVVPTKATDAQVTVATTCRWTATRGSAIPVRTKAERDALAGYAGMQVTRLDKGGLLQRHDGTKWRGQREHTDAPTVTLDSSGYATVTHGAGFTPVHVAVNVRSPISGSSSSGILMQNGTDTYTATTFRVRILNALGAAVAGSVAISYECTEAQD